MKLQILISILFVGCLPAKAYAFDSAESGKDGDAASVAEVMTLEDCLEYARKHAHVNIINRLEVEKAETEKRLAVSEMLPYVSLSGDGNLSFGRNIDPETNTYDNKKTLSTGIGLRMSLPVFDGLVRVNNYKAAHAAKKN